MRSHILDDEDAKSMQKEIDRWRKKMTELDALIKDAKARRDLTSVAKEIEENKTLQEKLGKEIESQKQEQIAVSNSRNSLAQILKEIKTQQAKMEKLADESGILRSLNKTLGGDNAIKTKFDAWILSIYFSHVLEYANRRLWELSFGRYQFKLGRGVSEKGFKGLDITVTDSWNGTERDASTLSGGETFEASISLALGLTDAVQASSGGIRLDSLFIDEGFGTLDTETLDKATSILNQLGETKTIGIISHVDAFRTAISSRIDVEKTMSGSQIKIT